MAVLDELLAQSRLLCRLRHPNIACLYAVVIPDHLLEQATGVAPPSPTLQLLPVMEAEVVPTAVAVAVPSLLPALSSEPSTILLSEYVPSSGAHEGLSMYGSRTVSAVTPSAGLSRASTHAGGLGSASSGGGLSASQEAGGLDSVAVSTDRGLAGADSDPHAVPPQPAFLGFTFLPFATAASGRVGDHKEVEEADGHGEDLARSVTPAIMVSGLRRLPLGSWSDGELQAPHSAAPLLRGGVNRRNHHRNLLRQSRRCRSNDQHQHQQQQQQGHSSSAQESISADTSASFAPPGAETENPDKEPGISSSPSPAPTDTE
ncbi:hypothetical protein Vretifemale_8077, partial [Volvox reticuliferus]